MHKNSRTSGRKPRTLSIGGATYDLFVRLPADIVAKHTKDGTFALPLGAKISVEEIIECCGGGANNTSVGFARLGCDASFEGVIGSDQWGEKLRENFRKEGVNSECVTVVEGEVTSFSIILSGSSRERVILYQSGTNRHLHDMMFNKDILKKVDWVYLNHIQEGSCVIQDDIAEILAEDGAPRLTWNPGGHQIRKGMSEKDNAHMLAHTDLLILNKEEAAEFSGAATTEEAIKVLLGTGAGIVCVTDGKNGSVAGDGKTLYRCPVAPDTVVLDTTGAGDAFGTGITWGLLRGMTLPEAMKTGSIQAASVVGTMGSQAGLLTDNEIRQRLKTSVLVVTTHSL